MTRSYAILSSLNVVCGTFTIDRAIAIFTFLLGDVIKKEK